MTPLFFGSGARRLFGLYMPARGMAGGKRAVVCCYPWGQEYLRSHRSMTQLSVQLANAGVHVLRFDYFGTGDSAGDMLEADIKGWESDILAAIEELKDTTGLSRVSLVGLRLGAVLAARAAAKRPADVDALVLWDPVVSGAEYLTNIKGLAESAVPPEVPLLRRSAEVGGGYDVLGFALSAAMEQDIQSVELIDEVPKLPAKTLMLVSAELPSHPGFRRAVATHLGRDLPIERISSQPAWLEDRVLGSGAVPVKILRRIVEWLT